MKEWKVVLKLEYERHTLFHEGVFYGTKISHIEKEKIVY